MIEDDEQETIQSVKVSFPELYEIKQVVLLPSEHLGRQKVSEYKPIELEPFPIFELRPLNFTVDERLFNEEGRKKLQTRGLLQIKEEEKRRGIRIWKEEPKARIIPRRIEMLFAKKRSSKSDRHEKDVAEAYIAIHKIESISFKKGIIKSSLIFKLKPESHISYFNIDPIEREFSLYISRKEIELAKQFLSAILIQISKPLKESLWKTEDSSSFPDDEQPEKFEFF